MFTRRHFNVIALAVPATVAWTSSAFAADARDRELGDADAPVAIYEYSSLSCPACAHFHSSAFKELKTQYIDTGKVRLIYRDFPTDGMALLVAQVPHCVGDAQYFPLLEQLFDKQSVWRNFPSDTQSVAMMNDLGLSTKLVEQGFPQESVDAASGSLREVMKISAIAGLSNQAAADCIGDAELRDSIWQRAEAGRNEFDIRSTPSFVIDGEVHAGSLPIEDFAEIIDPLL